jgi:UDP-N-acetylmuramate dehydrogenase
MVAKAAAKGGVAGLEFYAGIPGTIGGRPDHERPAATAARPRTCWSAPGATTAAASGASFPGRLRLHLPPQRRPEDIIWVEATYEGRRRSGRHRRPHRRDHPRREQTQPIREKTGGSTFKNPPATAPGGWSTRPAGAASCSAAAKFSELHSNFLINTGEATAADIEGLGESGPRRREGKFGVELDWEIKRIGGGNELTAGKGLIHQAER